MQGTSTHSTVTWPCNIPYLEGKNLYLGKSILYTPFVFFLAMCKSRDLSCILR